MTGRFPRWKFGWSHFERHPEPSSSPQSDFGRSRGGPKCWWISTALLNCLAWWEQPTYYNSGMSFHFHTLHLLSFSHVYIWCLHFWWLNDGWIPLPRSNLLQESGCPVLDVRSPKEFQKGHMPGARNLPLQCPQLMPLGWFELPCPTWYNMVQPYPSISYCVGIVWLMWATLCLAPFGLTLMYFAWKGVDSLGRNIVS